MNALIILIASLLFTASLSFWFWTRKRIEEFESRIENQLFSEQIIDQISALNAGSIGLGGRFLKLEKDLQALGSRLDDLQSQMQSHTPYAHAIALAQKGSTAEEIVELCDIGLNEAQLLVMMHQSSQAA